MAKKRKTKAEKIATGYRLKDFHLKVEEQREKKDASEFSYLSKEYVGKDLTKTVIYSVLIVGLLLLAKSYLG